MSTDRYKKGLADMQRAVEAQQKVESLKRKKEELTAQIDSLNSAIYEVQKECPHPRQRRCPGPGHSEYVCLNCGAFI